jgi:hypothetical protein
MRAAILLTSLLASASLAQTWSLSGTVYDGEEGDGIKNVVVTLAQAKVSATTDKKGKWSIGAGSGVLARSGRTGINHTLSLVDGRLHLQVDGRDILGRGLPSVEQSQLAAAWAAARSAGTTSDTLVYAKDGYATKRVAVFTASQSGLVDSLYRIRGPEWVIASHANVKSDTLHAFPDTLRKITFRFTKANWDSMMKAMADSCGKFGIGIGAGGLFGGGGDNPYATKCQESSIDFIENTALVWVPVDVLADGQTWKNVGLRLKGNASLMKAWSLARIALPFRITTDHFEDSFPLVKNQRFWGFQKLSFFNYDQDSSAIRGPVASEIFRQGGDACPISRPVQISLDTGNGNAFVAGLYEMLEIPDNPFLKRNFSNDSGNLYKPLSHLDKFVDSEWTSYSVVDSVPTFADVKNLIAVLNAGNRTSDSAAWHRNLEAVMDVKAFLNWLALSTAMFNWDAYGSSAHNYYLFDDRGVFEYIPYDFGWAFDYTIAATAGLPLTRTSIWYNGASSGWGTPQVFPLVKYLLADKNYCDTYRADMVAAIAGPASVASFQAKVDKYGAQVQKVQPGTSTYVSALRGFMTGRIPEIQTSLNNTSCPIQ